jgi:NitT/TauT family transport system substrate-binding protein
MSIERRSFVVKSAAFAAAAGSAPTALRAQALTPVQYGDGAPTAVSWTIEIARVKGFFERQRLSVEVSHTASNASIAQQVIGGSSDMGVTTVETCIRAVENGAPIIMIGSEVLRFPYSFMAAPSITRPSDLKGKKAILDLPMSFLTYTFKNWMRANHLQPDDVDLVFDGSSVNRFAALSANQVQVAPLTQPLDFTASDRGYKKLIDVATGPRFGFAGVIARPQWLSEKGDVARRFLRAGAAAVEWLYDPKNRDEAIETLVNYAKSEPAVAARVYQYYALQLHPFDRRFAMPDEWVKGNIDYLLASGEFKSLGPPSKYVDQRYL